MAKRKLWGGSKAGPRSLLGLGKAFALHSKVRGAQCRGCLLSQPFPLPVRLETAGMASTTERQIRGAVVWAVGSQLSFRGEITSP